MHDVVESLQVSSSALDVILHAAYFMSEVLLIEALPSYGLSSEECLSPSTSLQPRSGLRRARRLNGLLHRCCLAGRRAASTAPRTRKPRTRRQSARTQCPTLQAARRRGPPAAGSSMRAPPVPHPHPPASADASAQAPEAAWGLLLFELGTGLCRVFPCGVALLRQAVRCDLQFLAADASPRTVNGARGNVAGPSGNATTASLPSPLGSSRSCGASWATSRREYV